ncbi:MAG: glycosyltransferase family 39 protein [Pirellulales bacterium]|nr:glycosyltransferase family 39 protein [Pirellulales bacterium]
MNPPLVRMVAALPVLSADVDTSWNQYSDAAGRRAEFPLGIDLIHDNGMRSFELFTWARWACIPFSLIGAWAVYCWSRQLFGDVAGIAALTMWCLSPNILAHGQMITPDAGATSLGVLCCWRFWRWIPKPTWKNTLWFGLSLGLVGLTKFTWVILGPLLLVMWSVQKLGHRQSFENGAEDSAQPHVTSARPKLSSQRAKWIRFCVALLLAHQLILLAYAYDRVFQPLGEFEFVSDALKPNPKVRSGNIFRETWLGQIPVPLPACYLEGIDVQKHEFARADRPSYLAGKFRYPGWWYYYLYALGVKVPLGFWVIGVITVVCCITRKTQIASWQDQLFLLLPAVVILSLVSSHTGINRHMRYVLPVFPFVLIWISQAFASSSFRSKTFLTACAGLLWAAGSSLWVYPHSLSYFNEAVGGPRNGHKHLINSNIDWGQDLLLLRDWVQDHPEHEDISIAYFGGYDASAAGLMGSSPPAGPKTERMHAEMPRGPQPGWYAVSVNYFYRLYKLRWLDDQGKIVAAPRCDYSYFLEFEPVETIGYSIYIYYITEEQAREVRERIWADKD